MVKRHEYWKIMSISTRNDESFDYEILSSSGRGQESTSHLYARRTCSAQMTTLVDPEKNSSVAIKSQA